MPENRTTTDHEEIRRWAEERGGRPAAVVNSQNNEDIPAGGLRIDFPDYDGGEPLQEITWAEFFDRFEEENLTFIFQEEMVC
ncbi:MAG TPA: hypothetical protein VLB76_11090 [Thermoanaerobaculia bacterium]|jgi:hypothetical protein|nr:hypothetical protein [Thermoanaerobaculia bacterium]